MFGLIDPILRSRVSETVGVWCITKYKGSLPKVEMTKRTLLCRSDVRGIPRFLQRQISFGADIFRIFCSFFI